MLLGSGSEPYDPPVLAEQTAWQAERLMYRCASYERKRLWNGTQQHMDATESMQIFLGKMKKTLDFPRDPCYNSAVVKYE